MKFCNKCKENKELFNFYKDNSSKDGLFGQCKKCWKDYIHTPSVQMYMKNYHKEYYSKPEIKEKNKKKWENNKDKLKEYNKSYYQENKERIKSNNNKYNKDNKIKIKSYQKQYQKKHYSKPEIKEKTNKREKERRKNNPQFKLKCNLRSSLYRILKMYNGEKITSSLALVGCTILFLKHHLESQFLPEFTWENHGIIWEIDHIVPCSKFDLTILEEQQNCFHYTNLKPIFKTTEIAIQHGYLDQIGNRNKNNKII